MTNTPRSTRILLTVLGVPAILLSTLTGCTSTTSTSSEAHDSAVGTEEQQREKWNVDYRACLSKAGFELPEDGQVDFGSEQAAYLEAQSACEKKLGAMPSTGREDTPEEKAARREASKVSDQCFRDLGYTVERDNWDADQIPDGASEKDMNDCVSRAEAAREAALQRK